MLRHCCGVGSDHAWWGVGHYVGVAMIIELCDLNVPFIKVILSELVQRKNCMCLKFKTVCIKAYVYLKLCQIIWGGGGEQ